MGTWTTRWWCRTTPPWIEFSVRSAPYPQHCEASEEGWLQRSPHPEVHPQRRLSDLAVHFLYKTIGCRPIASLDHFTAENLASADLVEEMQTGSSKCVKITGMATPGKTCSIIIRGSNKLVLEDADRSIHDALCVIRCLVKKRFLISGGGAPETEVSRELMLHANSLAGADAIVSSNLRTLWKSFLTHWLKTLDSTLSLTELRNRHAQGEKTAGINVRKGAITNILEENVVQPLLVSTSSITLASETVRSILKIDDIVNVMRG